MQAFHGKQEIKDKYLSRVKSHRLADELIKGVYWESGKGCAVGCTIHDNNHAAYETELGIPEWLARLEDTIFEELQNERAKLWPEEFLSAIPVGVNLNTIKAPFLIFILELTLSTFDHEMFPEVKNAVCNVIDLYRAEESGLSKFRAAETTAARAGARAAASGLVAARAAVWAARAAEEAAWTSVAGAAMSARAAAAGLAAAASTPTEEAYVKFADKLLELFEGLEKLKHTPPPWDISVVLSLILRNGFRLEVVPGKPATIADGLLLNAAPDLLEALKVLLAHPGISAENLAKAAIAKAEGE